MARRDFITPPDLPTETIGRCVQIPASQEWLGLLNSALLFLTQEWRYEQIDDLALTPAECAAAGMLIYEAYLEANCMDCNDCFTGNFGLDDNADYRVEDGVPQFSLDDGTTWSNLPPGSSSPGVPPLVATPGDDTDEKRCLAATRATITISEFYKQTAGKAAVDLWDSMAAVARFLSSAVEAMFHLVYADYYAVVKALGLFECDEPCATYLGDTPTLDSEAQDILRCLLYDNASVSAGGIVTFDFNAVQDNLISVLGVNPGTVLTLLLAYLGGDGLNRAGNVAVTDTPADCSGCGLIPFCYEWDFEADDGDFVAGTQFGNTFGTWISGTGWHRTNAESSAGSYSRMVIIDRELSVPVRLTRMVVTYDLSAVTFLDAGQNAFVMGTDVETLLFRSAAGVNTGADKEYEWNGEYDAAAGEMITAIVRSSLQPSASYFNSATITKMRLEGLASMPPFGEDTCP